MPFEIAPQQTEQDTRKQLGRAALAAIAEHILTVPAAKFDLADWRTTRLRKPFLWPLRAMQCDTVGCAIGHSYGVPAVRATGLDSCTGTPVYQGTTGFPAIELAFGLSHDDAVHLFYNESYVGNATREEVSGRIREYLART